MAGRTKAERYEAIRDQLAGLLGKTRDATAHRATAVALLKAKLRDVSWAGFYLLRGGELVVDVYQGPVACLTLALHEGVCWAGIDRREPVVVPDVHEFPGHIPCDARTRAEIVVPLFDPGGEPMGVLDLDSFTPGRFDHEDRAGLTRIVDLLEDSQSPQLQI